MKKSNLVPIGISIVFAILAFLCIRMSMSIYEQNHRTAKGIVYEKFETQQGHYKSSRISNEFIMVVKEDNGHYFDLCVTPSTYATHKIGDRISFPDIRLGKLGEEEKGGEIFWIMIAGMLFLSILLIGSTIDR